MKPNDRSGSYMARIALGSMFCLAATAFASAQDPSSSVRNFQQDTISPDGTHVAWVESLATGGGGSAIYVQDLRPSSSQARRFSVANDGSTANEEDVSWSPDSKQLAFVSYELLPEK